MSPGKLNGSFVTPPPYAAQNIDSAGISLSFIGKVGRRAVALALVIDQRPQRRRGADANHGRAHQQNGLALVAHQVEAFICESRRAGAFDAWLGLVGELAASQNDALLAIGDQQQFP